ncbi:MAG: type II secretion system minor pseudopilin GspH [Gammaproteobacteria bacterium]|nr:type II secretion system minor pseudopilin GspH [Gammaproteobacteria bacterium]MCF6229638.1 type II secretion system minor pseudopilin GspH [Gammaproteobacteria bacterium]
MADSASSGEQSGFTLLELLVVIVIIGIMASFVVLSIGLGHNDEVKQEARRVQALIELAAQESLLGGREFGVRFNPQGYRFYTLNVGEERSEWLPVVDDEHLSQPRKLSEQIELELYVEGSIVAIEKPLEKGVHVFLLSSGEMTPFELLIKQYESGQVYYLTGSITGKLALQLNDADDA